MFTLELSADCRTVLIRSKDTSTEHVMAIHVGQPPPPPPPTSNPLLLA